MASARRTKQKREPRFDDDDDVIDGGELRLKDDERPSRNRKRREPAEDRRPRRRRAAGRGFLGTLIYWGFTLAIWGVLALACVVGYFAMKLPPIDQLSVPKRPPNVAILAADGSLIANRGETGGSAVPIGELPPYVGKAFVSIEDRRFYQHFGSDLVGLARAMT
jgi:penicillin-binding protein 1A